MSSPGPPDNETALNLNVSDASRLAPRTLMAFTRASPHRWSMPLPRRPHRAAVSRAYLQIARLQRSPHRQQQTRAMAGGKWPFGRKGNNDDEASGSRSRHSPPTPYQRAAPARPRSGARRPAPARPAPARPRDRVYVPVRMARRLYTRNQTVPWPDVNLPWRWHLNSRRMAWWVRSIENKNFPTQEHIN
jgi:hypothetical protein